MHVWLLKINHRASWQRVYCDRKYSILFEDLNMDWLTLPPFGPTRTRTTSIFTVCTTKDWKIFSIETCKIWGQPYHKVSSLLMHQTDRQRRYHYALNSNITNKQIKTYTWIIPFSSSPKILQKQDWTLIYTGTFSSTYLIQTQVTCLIYYPKQHVQLPAAVKVIPSAKS